MATKNHTSLLKRLTEKQQQADQLTVRAPVAGRFMSRSLVWVIDTYAKPGTELITIGDDSLKELRVSISQDDARWLDTATKQADGKTSIDVRLRSVGITKGTVRRILPEATRTPLHESLTAPTGGPLAVKANSDSESGSEVVLSDPRVTAVIDISSDVAARIPAGSFGHVWLKTESAPTIAEAAIRLATRWVESKSEAAQADCPRLMKRLNQLADIVNLPRNWRRLMSLRLFTASSGDLCAFVEESSGWPAAEPARQTGNCRRQ